MAALLAPLMMAKASDLRRKFLPLSPRGVCFGDGELGLALFVAGSLIESLVGWPSGGRVIWPEVIVCNILLVCVRLVVTFVCFRRDVVRSFLE